MSTVPHPTNFDEVKLRENFRRVENDSRAIELRMDAIETDNCRCHVYNDADITNIVSGVVTYLTFNQERYDPSAMHDGGSPARITITVPGAYRIGARVRWDNDATGAREVLVMKNHAIVIAEYSAPATNGDVTTQAHGEYELVAGDYLEVAVYQTSGANRTVKSYGNYSPEFWVSLVKASSGPQGPQGPAGPNNNLVGQTVPAFASTADDGKGLIWQTTAWIKAVLARLDAAGTFQQAMGFANGTAAACGIWLRSVGNGIYSAATNTLNIATGGTLAATITNSLFTIANTRLFQPSGGLSVTGKLLIGSNPDCSNAPNYERYMDLQADISPTATSCSVNNVTDGYGSPVTLPGAPFLLHMDDETVVVSAVSGAGPYTLTFGARHALGTTAADHYAGASAVYLTDTNDFLILQGAVRTAFANQTAPINAWLPPISAMNNMSPPTNGQVFKIEDAGNAGGLGPVRIRDWPNGSTIDVTINVNFASATFIFNASQLRYTLDAKSF